MEGNNERKSDAQVGNDVLLLPRKKMNFFLGEGLWAALCLNHWLLDADYKALVQTVNPVGKGMLCFVLQTWYLMQCAGESEELPLGPACAAADNSNSKFTAFKQNMGQARKVSKNL